MIKDLFDEKGLRDLASRCEGFSNQVSGDEKHLLLQASYFFQAALGSMKFIGHWDNVKYGSAFSLYSADISSACEFIGKAEQRASSRPEDDPEKKIIMGVYDSLFRR